MGNAHNRVIGVIVFDPAGDLFGSPLGQKAFKDIKPKFFMNGYFVQVSFVQIIFFGAPMG